MNERAMLRPHELQCWQMYVLLKKHKIKPWETNGGKVYPEDLNAILEFDKIIEHKQEKERKRAEMKERMRRNARESKPR